MSFRREKYVEFGGPDGGNGGRGGDVVFRVTRDANTLIDFRYKQHFRARPGVPGAGRGRTGPDGTDCIITVPAGTQILDEDKEAVLADLTEDGARLTFLRGGDGGRGNAAFKSATNQAPRRSEPGWPGAEAAVWLRLKLIADVGLVGLPNAGKSTFLSAVSNARPKVADYPFTTLHPNLGVVRAGDRELVVADIPGLIAGAHAGKGLGDRFLGHVERTRVLLHLVDVTDDDPAGSYRIVRRELTAYGHGLVDKPEIVALTKADALGPELAAEVAADFTRRAGVAAQPISAVAGRDVESLVYALAEKVGTLPA